GAARAAGLLALSRLIVGLELSGSTRRGNRPARCFVCCVVAAYSTRRLTRGSPASGSARAAVSHGLGPARDGGDAGARDLRQPELAHDRDELLDLGAASRDLEHEMLGR